jgi:ribose 5-phosphate isomerase B
MRIVVGCDNNGVAMKDALVAVLKKDPRISHIEDLGVKSASDATVYPDIGFALARKIADSQADRGLLICGTGIGMAISANKVEGIRAATTHDPYSLERAILSNDCQVICMGAKVITQENAEKLISQWLNYQFDSTSPSHAKVQRISALEKESRKRV